MERFENLVELAESSTRRYAERKFIGQKSNGAWRWTSYAEFQNLVNAFRSGLASLGVKPGDRVAIIANNRLEWAVAAHAVYGLAASIVPMYEAQRPQEWELILQDCGARVVLGSTDRVVAELDGMRARLGLDHVVAFDAPANDPRSYAALLEKGRAQPVESRHPASDAIALFSYTSGTTGTPKGVMLSHGNLASNIVSITSVFPIESSDVSLSFLPWSHVFGQIVELHSLLINGAATAINDDIRHLLNNLAEVHPTLLLAVPRVFHSIYGSVQHQIESKPAVVRALFRSAIRSATRRTRGASLGPLETLSIKVADRLIFSKVRKRLGGKLRYVISGSAALSGEVAEFVDALGIEVYEGYGLTETAPIVSANWPGSRKLGSVGKPIPGVQVSIDESVSPVPGQGEIIVKGPNVMKGYHARPDENAKALREDGALRTGDLGRLDEDGFLYVTGRIKEQYKLENGKYVAPVILEEQLKLSPFIANVMLYGANKPYNVALVIPNLESLTNWAKQEGIALDDPLQSSAVHDLLKSEIERCSSTFKSFERPRNFMLRTEDFTAENGMLTPTLKLRRPIVTAKYARDLEALYEAHDSGLFHEAAFQ